MDLKTAFGIENLCQKGGTMSIYNFAGDVALQWTDAVTQE
jgi:hypothetical protein